MDNIIIIGGSAGSFKVVSELMFSLPANFPGTFIICLHRLRTIRTGFREALTSNSKFLLKEAFDKEIMRKSIAYLAPANYHLLIEYGHRFSLSVDKSKNHSRPSIDMTMETAAEVFRKKVTGIILSGANMDGAAGMKRIKEFGGKTIIQDPDNAEIKTMPQAVINLFQPDMVLRKEKIIEYILDLYT